MNGHSHVAFGLYPILKMLMSTYPQTLRGTPLWEKFTTGSLILSRMYKTCRAHKAEAIKCMLAAAQRKILLSGVWRGQGGRWWGLVSIVYLQYASVSELLVGLGLPEMHCPRDIGGPAVELGTRVQ